MAAGRFTKRKMLMLGDLDRIFTSFAKQSAVCTALIYFNATLEKPESERIIPFSPSVCYVLVQLVPAYNHYMELDPETSPFV